jgi:hypothetical protein
MREERRCKTCFFFNPEELSCGLRKPNRNWTQEMVKTRRGEELTFTPTTPNQTCTKWKERLDKEGDAPV